MECVDKEMERRNKIYKQEQQVQLDIHITWNYNWKITVATETEHTVCMQKMNLELYFVTCNGNGLSTVEWKLNVQMEMEHGTRSTVWIQI